MQGIWKIKQRRKSGKERKGMKRIREGGIEGGMEEAEGCKEGLYRKD